SARRTARTARSVAPGERPRVGRPAARRGARRPTTGRPTTGRGARRPARERAVWLRTAAEGGRRRAGAAGRARAAGAPRRPRAARGARAAPDRRLRFAAARPRGGAFRLIAARSGLRRERPVAAERQRPAQAHQTGDTPRLAWRLDSDSCPTDTRAGSRA